MNISIDMIENENGVNFTVTDIWNAETLEDFDSDVDNVVYELARIMPLVNTKKMFEDAYKGGYAVGAFNVDVLMQCQAVLKAAEDCKSPVILAFSKGSREFFHPGNIKDILSF